MDILYCVAIIIVVRIILSVTNYFSNLLESFRIDRVFKDVTFNFIEHHVSLLLISSRFESLTFSTESIQIVGIRRHQRFLGHGFDSELALAVNFGQFFQVLHTHAVQVLSRLVIFVSDSFPTHNLIFLLFVVDLALLYLGTELLFDILVVLVHFVPIESNLVPFLETSLFFHQINDLFVLLQNLDLSLLSLFLLFFECVQIVMLEFVYAAEVHRQVLVVIFFQPTLIFSC